MATPGAIVRAFAASACAPSASGTSSSCRRSRAPLPTAPPSASGICAPPSGSAASPSEIPGSAAPGSTPCASARAFAPAADSFLAYLGDCAHRPDYAVVERPSTAPTEQTTSAPEIIRVAGDLIAWSGWPEPTVWQLPLGRAWWYYAMALRARGANLSFLDDEEREFQAGMRDAEKGQKVPK